VFVWSAIAGDGHIVDAYPGFVHVRVSHVERPRRAADVRDMASEAIRLCEHQAIEAGEPIATRRLTDVRLVHAEIVERAIARELELRDWNVEVASVQPGLFDRRAVRRADENAALRHERRLEHDQRIAALTRAGVLTSRCDLVAMLIVHASESCPTAPTAAREGG
jgi:hypothetical protein